MHVESNAAGTDFEVHRPLLLGIAYRMLGSFMEAEDIVQEAYLRYRSASSRDLIRNPRAFLSTVVTRLCLNSLQSARMRRETYLGPWLPEPLLPGEAETLTRSSGSDDRESISMAFLVILQNLTPAERAVLLLREVFDYEYAEIAETLGKQEAACRKLYSRAKRRVRSATPRYRSSPDEQRRLVDSFIRATSSGEMDQLTTLLAEDVVFQADGGGKARGAATRPLEGREAVARFLLATRRFIDREATFFEAAEINGEPAAIVREHGITLLVMTFEVSDRLIQQMRFIANPDKLQRFQNR